MIRPQSLGCLALLALSMTAGEAAKLSPCQPKRAQLFISPMGEPFRAGPNDPFPSAQWFARADADHDGKLTLAEMTADADRFFKVLDIDHDGQITPPENQAYENNLVPETRSQVGREADPLDHDERRERKLAKHAVKLPEGAAAWSYLAIPQPVISADADMNRAITRDEFRAAAVERFGLLDTDNKGYLMLATLPKTPVQAVAEAPCAAATAR